MTLVQRAFCTAQILSREGVPCFSTSTNSSPLLYNYKLGLDPMVSRDNLQSSTHNRILADSMKVYALSRTKKKSSLIPAIA